MASTSATVRTAMDCELPSRDGDVALLRLASVGDWTSLYAALVRRTWMPHHRSFCTAADVAARSPHAATLTPLQRRAVAFHRVCWAVQTTTAALRLLGGLFEKALPSPDSAGNSTFPLESSSAIQLALNLLYDCVYAIPTASSPLVRHLTPGAYAATAARSACLAMLKSGGKCEGLTRRPTADRRGAGR